MKGIDYLNMIAGCESLNGGNTDGSVLDDLGAGGGGGDGGGVLTGSGDAAIEEVRADLAESINVVEEAAQELAQVANALESHEEALEDLTENIAGMESMLQNGQFAPITFADKYNNALRRHVELGGQNMNRCGAESINDAATARIFAVAGLEGFMDTVKAGAGKAIDFIRGIFNSMISFFVGIFDTAKGLERRAAQLTERLGKGQLKDKIKLGGWNVGCDYATQGLKGIDSVTGHGVFDLANSSLPAFMDLNKKTDGINAAGFKSAYKAVTDDIKDLAKALGKPNSSEKGGRENILMVHAGFRIFATFEDKYESDVEMIAAARSIRLQFGKAEDHAKFSKGESPLKATITELKGLMGSVRDYATALRSSKVQAKFSKSERDQAIGNMNVQIKQIGAAGGTKEKQDDVKKSIALSKAIFISASSLTNTLDRLYVYLARQILDAVSAHIG